MATFDRREILSDRPLGYVAGTRDRLSHAYDPAKPNGREAPRPAATK